MWCKNNGCNHYDQEKNKCLRIGEDIENYGQAGICWMDENEYQHGIFKKYENAKN